MSAYVVKVYTDANTMAPAEHPLPASDDVMAKGVAWKWLDVIGRGGRVAVYDTHRLVGTWFISHTGNDVWSAP